MSGKSYIFKRFVRPYFILLTLVISVAAVLVYGASIEKIKNDAKEAGIQLAETKAKQVDSYLRELNTIAEQVKKLPGLVGTFYNLRSSDDDNKNYFDKDVLSGIDISSDLRRLLAERTANYNISIYNEYGDFVSSQNFMTKDTRLMQAMNAINYSSEKAMLHAADGMLVLPPQQNPWTDSDRLFITLVKELKNDYSDEGCGIIEVRVNIDHMAKTLGEDMDGTVLIRERSDGKVILPHNYINTNESAAYITAPLESINWEVAIEDPRPITAAYGVFLFAVFIIIYVILVAIIYYLTNAVGGYVAKPILELSAHVRNIDSPETKLERVESESVDEIKILEDSFDKMLERMNNSIRREKKAYSLALQAQMNPHFLYNMLTVISAAGSESGCDNIVNMCVGLSDMLRYVTAYEAVTVPLREEVAHTRNYLSLMKSRYEDYFNYSIEVDEELMNMSVPKLCIQPLTENSFMHGFKQVEPPWNIAIEMHGTSRNWELIVRDNGSGIPEEKISEIENKIEKFMSEMAVGEIGGIGVVNTVVRLKMIHDSSIKFRIYNENGAVIHITAGEKYSI